jgi:hypothetical protein
MARLLLIASLIGALVGQSSPSSPPERFEYMQGHGLGGHDQLTWEDGKLMFVTVPFNDEKRRKIQQFQPTAEAWERFWKAMDAAEVWKWQVEYPSPIEIYDAAGWSVELRHAGHSVKSHGYNNQPPGFAAFRDAVNELLKNSKSTPATALGPG